MKFSRSLVFNCVPEWAEHYIAYKSLRKLIEKIECAEMDASSAQAEKKSASPPAGATAVPVGTRLVAETEAAFAAAFNDELRKVSSFYRDELSRVRAAKEAVLARAGEDKASEALTEEIRAVYVLINDLRDFLTINNQGFVKIIRKHDKHSRTALDSSVLDAVDAALPPADAQTLLDWVAEVEVLYARIACSNNRTEASLQLRNALREKLVMARSSVWQEMVAMERKVSSVQLADASAGAGAPQKGGAVHHKKAAPLRVTLIKLGILLAVFAAVLGIGWWRCKTYTALVGCMAMSILIIGLWAFEVIPLYATSMLIPLLVSAMRIIYLPEKHEHQLEITNWRVLCNAPLNDPSIQTTEGVAALKGFLTDDTLKEAIIAAKSLVGSVAEDQVKGKSSSFQEVYACAAMLKDIGAAPTVKSVSKHIINMMFDSKIVQLLGGFAISAAATKYGIARAGALSVVGLCGGRPALYMLMIMLLCVLFSALISNVATPVLMYSIMSSTLRALPLESDYARQLIMAVCFASNIGGMITPISSPQNLIAYENIITLRGAEAMNWTKWCFVAIPVCMLAIFLCWGLLIFWFRGSMRSLPPALFSTGHQASGGFRLGFNEIVILVTTTITIVLWVLADYVKQYMGEAGIVAFIPLTVFFGLNILSKDDFNSFPWNVAMLAMGGTVLGHAMDDSGLLTAAGKLMNFGLPHKYLAVIVISFVLSAFTCFISHSVGAIIFVPLAFKLVTTSDWQIAVMMAVGFACSAGMAMPMSSFPNIAAISQENGAGRPFVTNGQFISLAAVASFLVWLSVATLGFVMMSLLNV